MKTWVEALGMLAAVSTTICWIPQALKILREKRTEGISLITQSIFTLGVALWAAYGLLLHDWPIMAANVTTLLVSGAILMMKIRYSRRSKPWPQVDAPAMPSKLVQTVEGSNLVSLGERGIVEDRVAKIIDGASVAQHSLTDVDNLGGSLPERVDAQ